MIVVDASVWVSSFVAQDEHFATSAAWLRRQIEVGQRFIVPTLLMAEVAGAIRRRTNSESWATQVVQRLTNITLIRWISVDHVLASAAAQLAIDLRLRGADAIYVAVAARFQIPLVSWDREHLERSQPLISAYSPQP